MGFGCCRGDPPARRNRSGALFRPRCSGFTLPNEHRNTGFSPLCCARSRGIAPCLFAIRENASRDLSQREASGRCGLLAQHNGEKPGMRSRLGFRVRRFGKQRACKGVFRFGSAMGAPWRKDPDRDGVFESEANARRYRFRQQRPASGPAAARARREARKRGSPRLDESRGLPAGVPARLCGRRPISLAADAPRCPTARRSPLWNPSHRASSRAPQPAPTR